ncbi:hypothetical protein CFC21_062554 [Triticum aestivum]|uniref:Protein ENHANCED DISEASE RESISTANCE 2 C-terminal domain-containing protein n=2 Tax=Triticum aestivum TaxID=4565 RepID=A0A9R1GWC3_WHEAT|nr:hypothetical protein CFC21_062554 [Triticum aestivum]
MFARARKVCHIALPSLNPHDSFPSLLIVSVQLPTYPTTMFGENDGDGVSPVLYLKIFDSFDKEISPRLKDSIKSVMNEETKKVKGFPGDNNVPYTERLKILAGIINPEDLQLSTLKTFRSRCCLDPSTSSTRDPLSASFIDSDPLCHWNDLDSAIVTSPRLVLRFLLEE